MDPRLPVSIQLLQLDISHPHPKQRLKTSGKTGFHGLKRREASENGHTVKRAVLKKHVLPMSFITQG